MLTFCFQYPKYGLADHADAMLGALQWEVNGRRIAGPAIERNREKWPRYRGVTRRLSRCVVVALLQLRVLRLGLLQDGDVGVGVFPEGEEILVRSFRLGGVTRKRVGRLDEPVRRIASYFESPRSAQTSNLF